HVRDGLQRAGFPDYNPRAGWDILLPTIICRRRRNATVSPRGHRRLACELTGEPPVATSPKRRPPPMTPPPRAQGLTFAHARGPAPRSGPLRRPGRPGLPTERPPPRLPRIPGRRR